MSYLAILLVVVLAASYYGTYATPSFEIHSGNCSTALVRDRVCFQHVNLNGIPFVHRESRINWYGHKTIYCVIAKSLLPASKQSTAEILSGGLRHADITVYLRSDRGSGMEYNVEIYANRTHKADLLEFGDDDKHCTRE